jgi:phosphoribosyl 1,2-cyclic phosphodiesterase
MKFLVLATGSKGNCAYIGTPHSQVLVDCGIPLKDVVDGLRAHGIDPRQLDALFITHTHSDHLRSVPALLRQHPMRIYCPSAHLPEVGTLVREFLPSAEFVPVEPNQGFHHRDLDILPVPVSHDCSPTVMYKFHCGARTVGMLTDLGTFDARLTTLFCDCDVLLLESNHCRDMLLRGRYPERLKRRIRSELGHLSNDEAAQFALGLASMPQHLLLGHLSDDNNTPEVASAAFSRIELGGMIPHRVIAQRTLGPLVELG